MWRTLEEKIPVEGENLRLVRKLAEEYFRAHTGPECWEAARALYGSPHFQVQEAGVFLCGWLAPERPEGEEPLHAPKARVRPKARENNVVFMLK